MVIEALNICRTALLACIEWFDSIIQAVDGSGVIIAMAIVVFVVSMFLMPLRGSGFTQEGFADFTKSRVNKSAKKWRSKLGRD